MSTENTRVIVCTLRTLREGIFARLYRILCTLIFAQAGHVWLVSEDMDPDTEQGKASAVSKLRLWWTKHEGPDSLVTMSFTVDQDFGKPAAVLLNSFYSTEFFLQSITLHMPDGVDVYFPCHTWISHSSLYSGTPRVLFSNSPYLPNKTPLSIRKLRKSDLLAIRGNGTGKRLHGQRIYDYDVYNDLGNPDGDASLARPILGGSPQHPYPRRCRTGREPTETDSHSEKPAGRGSNAKYVPRDEMFSAIKKLEFFLVGVYSVGHNVFLSLERLIRDDRSFLSEEQLHYLYDGHLGSRISKAAVEWLVNHVMKRHVIKRPTDGRPFLFPIPGIAKAHENAWDVDSEYGRQRLAGVNPLVIQRMESFPPISSLDPKVFGPRMSAITSDHLRPLLEGLSVLEALEQKRLYIVDYHDALMPFINKINGKEIKGKAIIYAPRTLFYLRKDGALVPTAIELSLPPTDVDEAKSQVLTADGPDWLWRLAKAHAAIVDSGYHQLVSHWLHTHACVEPFVIATRRQLSTMHPLHMLLSPHLKDTMHINALARSSLIQAGGIIESNFTPGKYCMEISSAVYKGWRFDQQALPKDLLKRGMAVEDKKHGRLKLTIENYPYAVDGLEVWAAIEQWVEEYVKLYYKDDKDVQEDEELQGWWDEVKKVGHGDHAGADWWSKMEKVEDVIEVMTTLVWMASALHAAVNFGQYAYGGYMPNNPTMARRLIPEKGTPDYNDMLKEPEAFFFNTVSAQGTTAMIMAILEILASHMSEEEYLGERKDPTQWSADRRAKDAFNQFSAKLKKVGRAIKRRNEDSSYDDEADFRQGPAQLPYTLLHPASPGPGLTFSGIPNSISI